MNITELFEALGSIVLSNGLLEAAVAVIVCIPILIVLAKIFGRPFKNEGHS